MTRRFQFSLETILLACMAVLCLAAAVIGKGRSDPILRALVTMRPSYYMLIGCLVLAVVLAFILGLSRGMSEKTQWRLASAVLFACYGVCVAIVSLLLSHFFELREWLAILIAVPLGLPVLVLIGKVSEG